MPRIYLYSRAAAARASRARGAVAAALGEFLIGTSTNIAYRDNRPGKDKFTYQLPRWYEFPFDDFDHEYVSDPPDVCDMYVAESISSSRCSSSSALMR